MKKVIIFSRDGEAFSDFSAEEEAKAFLQCTVRTWIETSTENFIAASRCLVAENVVPGVSVHITTGIAIIDIKPDGQLSDWPPGFTPHMMDWLARIAYVQKRIRDKKKEGKQ